MARMVSLKRPKEAKDESGPTAEYRNPDDEGVAVHLDHHHLEKMGLGGQLKNGHKVSFSGEGTVESASSRSDKGGERHSATLRLKRGGVEHKSSYKDDGDGDDLKGELAKNYEASEGRKK